MRGTEQLEINPVKSCVRWFVIALVKLATAVSKKFNSVFFPVSEDDSRTYFSQQKAEFFGCPVLVQQVFWFGRWS